MDESLESDLAELRWARGRRLTETHLALAARLAAHGDAAVKPLTGFLREGRRTRWDVARIALTRIGDPAVKSLGAVLKDGNAGERCRAARALGEIATPSAFAHLRDALAPKVVAEHRRKRLSKAAQWVVCVVVGGTATWLIPLLVSHRDPTPLLLGWFSVTGLVGAVLADRAWRERRTVADALASATDPAVGGVLAACLLDRDEVSNPARRGLQRLLPAVTEQHADEYDIRAIGALLRELDGPDRSLKVAVLHALGEVGDERAIPAIERVTLRSQHRQVGPGRVALADAALAQAAVDCLAKLKVRVEKLNQAKTLLRPASAPDSEVLLRPAGAGDSAQEQLLRPVDGT